MRGRDRCCTQLAGRVYGWEVWWVRGSQSMARVCRTLLGDSAEGGRQG